MNTLHRLSRVRAVMKGKKIDAFLLTSPYNRRYLSHFSAKDPDITESSGSLLILPHEAILLTDGRYEVQARQETAGWRISIYKKGLSSALKEILKGQDIKRIACEPAYMTLKNQTLIKKALKGVELVPLDHKIEGMRTIKEEAELECIIKAISIAESVFEMAHDRLRPGVTEKEVAWWIVEALSLISEGPSFPPIVASGPNAALPHAVPTERAIQEGEPIIIDMGASFDGYCSDMTRTLFLGEPDYRVKKIYAVVRKAQLAAISSIREGMTCRDADAAAREIIQDEGYGDYFVHSLGHGVGLAVHEAPFLSSRSRKSLRAGMVTTVEPGIYIPEVGGVRLEQMVLIHKHKAVLLSQDRWFYDF